MSSSATTDDLISSTAWRVDAQRFAAPHLFTSRRGGVSDGPFSSLNLGDHVGDDVETVTVNRRRVAATFRVPADEVRWARQVHGRRVWNVDRFPRRPGEAIVEADALVAASPGTVLAIAVADCVPLLLADPSTGTVAAVHVGWRGASSGVVEATVASMCSDFGVDTAGVQAAIGPSIEGRCYQVGGDVAEAVRDAPGVDDALSPDPHEEHRWRLDVATLVTASLVRLGVPRTAISTVNRCTSCNVDTLFSHRRDGPRTGRQAAFVQVPFTRDEAGG